MADDNKPETFDRRGPENIEPGHKGGSGESQGRSVTKDATQSDKPNEITEAKDRPAAD